MRHVVQRHGEDSLRVQAVGPRAEQNANTRRLVFCAENQVDSAVAVEVGDRVAVAVDDRVADDKLRARLVGKRLSCVTRVSVEPHGGAVLDVGHQGHVGSAVLVKVVCPHKRSALRFACRRGEMK